MIMELPLKVLYTVRWEMTRMEDKRLHVCSFRFSILFVRKKYLMKYIILIGNVSTILVMNLCANGLNWKPSLQTGSRYE